MKPRHALIASSIAVLLWGCEPEEAPVQHDLKGRYSMYVADQEVDDQNELYLVDNKDGTVTRLNPDLPLNGDVIPFDGLRLDPKARRAVYIAEQEDDDLDELFAVEIPDGPSRKLNGSEVNGSEGLSRFDLTRRGDFVVYLVNATGGDRLYAYDFKKDERRLLSDLTPSTYRVDSRGRYVVFRAQEESGVNELFSVRLKTGEVRKINAPLQEDGDVLSFLIGPRGRFVYYRADAEVDVQVELYRVRIGGSKKTVKARRLSEVPEGGDVDVIALGGRGRRVAYLQSEGSTTRIYSAKSSGRGEPRNIGGDLVEGGVFGSIRVGPRDRNLLFNGEVEDPDVDELFVASMRKGDRRKLSGSLPENSGVSFFQLGPRGRYVAWGVNQPDPDPDQLWLSPLKKKGGEARMLTDSTPTPQFGPNCFDPRGRYYLSLEADESDAANLYRERLRKPDRLRLNGELGPGADVFTVTSVDPRGRFATYTSDEETPGTFELFRTDLRFGFPTRINGDLVSGGDVFPVPP